MPGQISIGDRGQNYIGGNKNKGRGDPALSCPGRKVLQSAQRLDARLAVSTPSAVSEATSHAMSETATAEMCETYAAIRAAQAPHAAAEAMVEAVVVRVPAIKYGGVAVIAVIIPA